MQTGLSDLMGNGTRIVDGLWVITLLGWDINGSISGDHVWTGAACLLPGLLSRLLNIFTQSIFISVEITSKLAASVIC